MAGNPLEAMRGQMPPAIGAALDRFGVPGKNKSAPQVMPAPQVSTAPPEGANGFYERQAPTQRTALLQAMMARTRGGSNGA